MQIACLKKFAYLNISMIELVQSARIYKRDPTTAVPSPMDRAVSWFTILWLENYEPA